METQRQPAGWQLVLAFASLYLIWGSTYLAIKVTVETMPPFLMAASRFVLAGAVLYGWAIWRGVHRPKRSEWIHAAMVGTALIAGGNGLVTLAETRIDSSMAALIISSNPLFMALFGWWGGVQKRPGLISGLSLLCGFAGVATLVASSSQVRMEGEATGYLTVLLAVLSWTVGSIYSKRHPVAMNPWLQSGMQMICGGLVCLAAGSITGEFAQLDFGAISSRSWWAYWFLVLFGSLAGYTSYVFLLRHCQPSTVASHAYVNPVVAVFLGWLLLDERLGLGGWIGSVIVLASVFALLRRRTAV